MKTKLQMALRQTLKLVTLVSHILERLIIFWVKQCDAGCRHRSSAQVASNKACTLTDPEVIQSLAHGAALIWDLIEVLVKTRLEWDESRQGREVVF